LKWKPCPSAGCMKYFKEIDLKSVIIKGAEVNNWA
jgi:hypothetical protein